MSRGIPPGVDQMASVISGLQRRTAALERAASSGGGSGTGRATGEFVVGGWATAPDGMLLLDGVLILGGAITYPGLAAMFPSWVTGTDLTPPLADGATFLPSSSAAGVVAGSMSRNLTPQQMPEHDHVSPQHAHTTNNHAHSIDHNHAAFNTASGGAHLHLGRYLTTATGSGNNADLLRPGTSSFSLTANINAGGTASGAHIHNINVPNFTGQSGNAAPSTNNNAFSMTGAAGLGDPVDITPKHLTVKVAVVI